MGWDAGSRKCLRIHVLLGGWAAGAARPLLHLSLLPCPSVNDNPTALNPAMSSLLTSHTEATSPPALPTLLNLQPPHDLTVPDNTLLLINAYLAHTYMYGEAECRWGEYLMSSRHQQQASHSLFHLRHLRPSSVSARNNRADYSPQTHSEGAEGGANRERRC